MKRWLLWWQTWHNQYQVKVFGLFNETLIVMMTNLTQPIPSKSFWFIQWNVDCYDDKLDTTNTKRKFLVYSMKRWLLWWHTWHNQYQVNVFGLFNETLIVMTTHLTQPIPSKSFWFIQWNVDCYDDTLDTTNTK